MEPLPTPGNPHSAGYFDSWVSYFIDLIGGAVERMNGHQFNLDLDEATAQAGLTQELDDLAAELCGPSTNPRGKLHWPLAGPYSFEWDTADANAIGYDTFVISLYFENEPDYRMVVNATVELTAEDSPGQPISSSSSYLATSSSG